MKDRCQMTICSMGAIDHYYACGKPAKYMTPEDSMNKPMLVCGIHKNSVDSMYKKRGVDTRCKKITSKEAMQDE